MQRVLSYPEAIVEAQNIAIERDPGVFVMGVGVDDPGGIFGSTIGTYNRFGDERCFDVPISENALTGAAVGAALMGARPILVHARCDFLLLTLDQIANHAAKWAYMSGGLRAPILVRAVIGRGWGQAAQHSQSLQAVFAGFPGLHVIMPTTPYDVKGMLLSALEGDHPVICFEHRWSYNQRGHVPEGHYSIPIGRAVLRREGTDCTIAAIGQMVDEANLAGERLSELGISVEVLDLRSVRPWDEEAVLKSVAKTGRLVVADSGWRTFGVSAEISATVSERLFGRLRAPVSRIALPDVPTPCAPNLEAAYYPGSRHLVSAVTRLMGGQSDVADELLTGFVPKPFVGAF